MKMETSTKLKQMVGTEHRDAVEEKIQAAREEIGKAKHEYNQAKKAFTDAAAAENDDKADKAEADMDQADKRLARAHERKKALEHSRPQAERNDWKAVVDELEPSVREALKQDAEAIEGIRKAAVTLGNKLNAALEVTDGNAIHAQMDHLAQACRNAGVEVPDDIEREPIGKTDWFALLSGNNKVGKLKSDKMAPTTEFKKAKQEAARRAQQLADGLEPDLDE